MSKNAKSIGVFVVQKAKTWCFGVLSGVSDAGTPLKTPLYAIFDKDWSGREKRAIALDSRERAELFRGFQIALRSYGTLGR